MTAPSEGGRVVKVYALLAAGVNVDGHREILGLQVTSAEDGAGWLAFFRDLTTRGLTGVQLVTSDAHRGLVEAIGATLPGAAWRRCRTHYAANLMSVTPMASWPWVKTLLHSVCDQPDTVSPRTSTRPARRPGLHQLPPYHPRTRHDGGGPSRRHPGAQRLTHNQRITR